VQQWQRQQQVLLSLEAALKLQQQAAQKQLQQETQQLQDRFYYQAACNSWRTCTGRCVHRDICNSRCWQSHVRFAVGCMQQVVVAQHGWHASATSTPTVLVGWNLHLTLADRGWAQVSAVSALLFLSALAAAAAALGCIALCCVLRSGESTWRCICVLVGWWLVLAGIEAEGPPPQPFGSCSWQACVHVAAFSV
jgi:hypothetical protein